MKHFNERQIILSRLLQGVDFVASHENEILSNISIYSISLDSRSVSQKGAFVAIGGSAGSLINGENYIEDAILRGAEVIIVERGSFDRVVKTVNQSQIIIIAVKGLKATLGKIAANFYGKPSHDLSLVGVTGTNGKSTIVSLVAQLEHLSGRVSGTIGTLGYGLQNEGKNVTGLTTPDIFTINQILRSFVDNTAKSVAMEVSSHGIEQERIAGLDFDVAVLANITRDHLDYHKTFDAYKRVKHQFITSNKNSKLVVNIDSPECAGLAEKLKKESTDIFSYSIANNNADFYASEVKYSENGISAQISSPWGRGSISCELIGDFNLSNLIAAIAICSFDQPSFLLNVSHAQSVEPVAGRMQSVRAESKTESLAEPCLLLPSVYVDYAHTPDALKNALRALRKHCDKKMWVVFGCGGDRDQGKRSEMGEVASDLADCIIVTSDNPRNESPADIIHDIESGIEDQNNLVSIESRETAIEYAIANAAAQDCILIAGKGHEEYQIIGDQTLPFSDIAIARTKLTNRCLASEVRA